MIQLRCRTEFSFGETFAPVSRIVARCAELGAEAAGIVDRGTWGHVGWAEECKKAGIAPMFGVQIAVVPQLDFEDRPAMWFLALSSAGLQELYRFNSRAQRQAARGSGRLTYEDVREMSADIAKFAGQVTDAALLRDVEAYADFDPSSALLNRKKAALGMRPVVISDNFYSRPEDRQLLELIGKTMKVTPQHLLSVSELGAALPQVNMNDALANASEIAHCAATARLPRAPIIQVAGDLEALCREGIRERGMGWTEEYEARLRRELGMIRQKNFESYFLVVADMTRYAKTQMLVGPSRGSAAGSLVCYLTRITEIDPLPTGLIFERFIDVTREDLPDIDLDFTDSKRELVLRYLRTKYGERNVTQIGTVSTFQPRSALIAVAKQLRIPPWETNAVKDSIFERSSGDSRANFALLDTLEQTEPGRKLLEKFPAMKLAAELEAHATHCGVHAGGVLVCNEEIENFCSVSGDGVAQIDKKDAEKLNLLKIDVLGLRTLGILEDSGIKVDWHGLPLDDPAVFELLNKKRFSGIFQFEGQALQSVSSQMTVKTIYDIGHITALARPGPLSSGGSQSFLLRRAGKEEFSLPHPALDPYVRDTYGVVMYQEQVLRICKELGDMTWEDTTDLRKAMSKSYGKEFFDKYRDKFVVGAAKSGVERDSAIAIWEMVNTMGSYVFNLAHSYSYAVVSYWTAWLKAHHPLEFTAATLRSAKDDESAIKLLRELIREGVAYVAFDPELSEVNWSVKDGKLVGGFTGLKGIGPSKAQKLVEKRAAAGGRLSETERTELSAMKQSFSDLFPTERRFGDYYREPERFGLRAGTRVLKIEEIAGAGEFVYIGRLVDKDLRDQNETIRVARRNGKLWKGPTLFLDLSIEDDTGRIFTRIDRYDFETIGRPIWENAVIGSWWLVRGERKLWGRPEGGFRMIYVSKIKQLPDPFPI